MTYRDSFERCPRCGVELADARSARSCSACGGLWVDEAVLAEMVQDMVPSGPLGRLQLAVLNHGDPAIACPRCGEQMLQTMMYQVPIERCAKGHGVWFDRDELAAALYRIGQPGAMPVLVEIPPVVSSITVAGIAFEIFEADQPPRATTFYQDIIKIGRGSNTDVTLRDSKVSRTHALIDATNPQVVLVDLGSQLGTFVNGEPTRKRFLASGDQIRVGDTRLTVTFSR